MLKNETGAPSPARKAAEEIYNSQHEHNIQLSKQMLEQIIEAACSPVAPPVKLVQTDYGSEIAWNTGAAPAVSTSPPFSRCPKCEAPISMIYECDNGHEFQGPDVVRVEAGTVGGTFIDTP